LKHYTTQKRGLQFYFSFLANMGKNNKNQFLKMENSGTIIDKEKTN